jgi:hypothetical protein
MEPRNRCQGINSASLCTLAGRYDNHIPTRCLAPIEFLKIPAPYSAPPSITHQQMVGSLKMNTTLGYSTRVVQEGDRRCKKSTLNDLAYLTPLRIPLMNPVSLSPRSRLRRIRLNIFSVLCETESALELFLSGPAKFPFSFFRFFGKFSFYLPNQTKFLSFVCRVPASHSCHCITAESVRIYQHKKNKFSRKIIDDDAKGMDMSSRDQ